MKIPLVTILMAVAAVPAYSQITVPFCELMRHPEQYNGKLVRVRVTFKSGFEMSDVYCLDCKQDGRTWLEFPPAIDDESMKNNEKMGKKLKLPKQSVAIVNLTVEGTFFSNGTYGHLGGYRHKIVVRNVSEVVVLNRGMKSIERQREAERRWACGGESPK